MQLIIKNTDEDVKEYEDYHYVRKPLNCKVCRYGGIMTQEQFDGYIEGCNRCSS